MGREYSRAARLLAGYCVSTTREFKEEINEDTRTEAFF